MMQLKVLGPGCPRCEELAERAGLAAEKLGLEYELEKIKDISEFPSYGLMMTPGLVVDGQLRIQGKLPTVDQIEQLLGGGK
jgi:small redox-active disulfide protein 2